MKMDNQQSNNKQPIGVECLIQHFKVFYEQSIDGQLADWGEPCSKCPYMKECGCSWYENIQPLLEKTKIEVEFPLPSKLE